MARDTRIPAATYRLQFNADFSLDAGAGVVPYLPALGISHLYASPLFQAGPTSTHGYDVCSYSTVSPLLGGEKSFRHLVAALRKKGMELLLDVVPNHMGNDLSNTWWVDVLKNGPDSQYARWFDIDWHSGPNRGESRPQVLLPVLEDRYGAVLEAGKLRVVQRDDVYRLAYYDREFPINEEGQERIRHWVEASEQTADAALNEFNGTVGNDASFAQLDALIRIQHYRLAFWRVAPEEINYRRFFDITGLVSMRMELPEVFCETHRTVGTWLAEGSVAGLRIDHPDGLWNPRMYFDQLQQLAEQKASSGVKPRAIYVVAEKILSGDEPLPQDWPVDGTTGYDFLNQLNGIFVASENEESFSVLYQQFTGLQAAGFSSVVRASKLKILQQSFPGETSRLALRLKGLASKTRRARDFTLPELHQAILDIVVAFPVYRTYVTEETTELSQADLESLNLAFRRSVAADPKSEAPLAFLRDLLSLKFPADLDEAARSEAFRLIMRLQQLTGPVMAKGLEDTAFYQYNRLISLNEVGGEPDQFGVTPAQFHEYAINRQKHWPGSLNATATHDTKRGEDVRARLNVLSEMPEQFGEALNRWSAMNAAARRPLGEGFAPDRNDELFLYQTLIGAWPPDLSDPDDTFVERIIACLVKSLKESKRHTSWTEPNTPYEEAATAFVRSILARSGGRQNLFLEDLKFFIRPVLLHGAINSISQVIVKSAAPGVPDIYQGSELWDLSLVDPDNRRPVDYSLRREWLEALNKAPLEPKLAAKLLKDWQDLRIKLFVLSRLLQFRNHNPDLFYAGDYVPLNARGAAKRHLFGFSRLDGPRCLSVVLPRLSFTLMRGAEKMPTAEDWGDTVLEIPPDLRGACRNLLTGEEVHLVAQTPVAAILRVIPFAALAREAQ